jgi:hypothetical protein
MILRFSRKLGSRLKAGTLKPLPMDDVPVADWTSHVFFFKRTPYILVTNIRLPAMRVSRPTKHSACPAFAHSGMATAGFAVAVTVGRAAQRWSSCTWQDRASSRSASRRPSSYRRPSTPPPAEVVGFEC